MQGNRDTVVASASVQRTPRVSIVLSSYEGGGDHFGNAKFSGVPEPRPATAELTEAQLRALTRRAVELGNHPNQGLRRIVGRGEAVALLVSRSAEPAVVSAVTEMVKEHAEGVRVSVIGAGETVRMPAPGVWSRRDVTYQVPKAVLECDRLISIAPLRLEKGRPSLGIDNYRMLAETAPAGDPDTAAMDLYGFHPADYVVLGGSQVLRNGARVRHNLVLAGAVPGAVDTVAAAILNVKPESVRLLKISAERFGKVDPDEIWTMGNEIEDARVPS